MPDTLSSLIAKLGDCPKTTAYLSATKMYREGRVPLTNVVARADAALLELAQMVEKWIDRDYEDCDKWMQRAEAAEADLAMCYHDKDAAEQRLMEAEAEVERLRGLITAPVLRMHDKQREEAGDE